MTAIRIKLAILCVLAVHLNIGCLEKEGPNCHRSIQFKNNTDKKLIVGRGYDYLDMVEFAHYWGYIIVNEGYHVHPKEINTIAFHRFLGECYWRGIPTVAHNPGYMSF